MKDIIIKVFQYGNIYAPEGSLGINYENLQGRLIFDFEDFVVEGTGYLEFERDGEKGLIPLTYENEQYYLEIKSSLLKKEGIIKLQLRITEDKIDNEIPVFKSEVFELEVKEAINATSEIPDEYPEWIDLANTKIKEMDNLNITTERIEDGVNIKVTNKDGSESITKVNDGLPGPKGEQGNPGAVKMEVVDTLPETAETDIIYLLKKENPSDENLYEEYVYTSTGWEHIGDTSVDLSDYYTKEETTENIYTNLDKFIKTILPKDGEDFIAVNDGRMLPRTSYLLPIGVRVGFYYEGTFKPFTTSNTDQIPKSDVFNGSDAGLKRIRIITVNDFIKYPNTDQYINLTSLCQSPSTGVAAILNGTYLKRRDINTGHVYHPGSGYPSGPVITQGDFYANYLIRYLDGYISKKNTTPYTPTADYHPSTKKYVDDAILTINIPTLSEFEYGTYQWDWEQFYNGHNYNLKPSFETFFATIINDAYSKGKKGIILHKTGHSNYFQDSTNYLFVGPQMNLQLQPTNLEFVLCNRSTLNFSKNSFISQKVARIRIGVTWADDICTISYIYWDGDTQSALTTENITEYTPTSDYNPATKKYVDDAIATAIIGALEGEY